jgi:hypothetical protein
MSAALTHPMGAPTGCIYDTWTSEDFVRLNRLNLARKLIVLSMIRKGDRQDALVMKMRALAKARGATPNMIEANVMAYDHDTYPIPVKRGPW